MTHTEARPAPDAAGGAPASTAAAAAAVDRIRDVVVGISPEVWANAELSLSETVSAEIHLRELSRAGFTVTDRGTAGVPTAFIAEWTQGTGGPVVGYLPEYDALPGLGNAAEPRQAPGPTGMAIGHGCGHNMLGAGCTGAAIALKGMMDAAGTPGTVRVYGCAAEETEGAKVYMARAGLFDDCDACLAWHPASIAATGNARLNAVDTAKVIFHGTSAHAGLTPWDGRSALKAAEMFGIGVQMMREHILPSARIHYVLEEAGVAPNVVPDLAQVWIMIRDLDREKVGAMTRWIREIAEGAALATQTRAEFDLYYGLYDLLPNEPLARHLHRHMLATPIEWTDDEQEFARACQREMGLAETGLATSVMPFLDDVAGGGSSDLGDVSHQIPVGLFVWPTAPLEVSAHTWAVTACGGTTIGDKATLSAARILAATGFDLMTDAGLRERARQDLDARRGDRVFVSALPETRTSPRGLPAYMTKTGQDDIMAGAPLG